MLLWLLRLISVFRELENLCAMQARNLEESEKSREAMANKVEAMAAEFAELQSDRVDLQNLREAHQDLITEKLLLEDRLNSALEDKQRLWDSMQEALNGERNALRTMVNHSVQKNGGGIPFPDAHSLPPSEIRKVQTPGPVGRSQRILPSEITERASRKFVNEYVQTLGPKDAVS